jgi:phosphoenolpyruvate-protein kinase (PTS system EI component)
MGSTTLQGLPASPGIAVGRCWTVDRRKVRTPRRKVSLEEVEAELARLEAALELSVQQLDGVRAKVEASEGAEHVAIIDVHRTMLRDPSLVDEVRRLVREERVNVEWAVKRAIRKIKGAFDPDDEFFRERRSDVEYVGERIVKNLLGHGVDVAELPPDGSVVVARDLSPADTALLLHDRKVVGLVTDAGGTTSHTAIVARALEIPAVVGAGRASVAAERGDWIVVDGSRGVVVVNPTAGERADYEAEGPAGRDRGRRSHRHARQHRVRRGGPGPALPRRRRRGALPHRVSLHGKGRAALRGGALPRLPHHPRGHGRPAGHGSHLRPGRRQAPLRAEGPVRESRTRPPGGALLSAPP